MAILYTIIIMNMNIINRFIIKFTSLFNLYFRNLNNENLIIKNIK